MNSALPDSTLPHGWRWLTAEAAGVKVFDCPHSTPKLTAQGPFVIRTQDIDSGTFRSEKAAHVSVETYRERVVRAEPRYGDIVYSREGAYYGVAAEVPANMLVCLGQRMVLIRPPADRVDHRFLKYVMNSRAGRAFAESHREGSAAPRINLPTIRSFPIPLPPIGEQQTIAATLGALDDKIESNLRAMDLSSLLLDALAADAAFESPLKRLGDLVEKTNDTLPPAKLGTRLVDHYSLPAFDKGERPERVPAQDIMSNKLLVPGRSILLSRLNPRINRIWWVTPTDGFPALASTEFLCMRTQDDEALAAAWLAVRTEAFLKELPQRVTGTSGSHQRVRPDDVLDIMVPDMSRIPVDTKQAALALLQLREQASDEIAVLESLRDTLVPELLSGRIRVVEAEGAVAEAIA